MTQIIWVILFFIVFAFMFWWNNRPVDLSTEQQIVKTINAEEAKQRLKEKNGNSLVLLDLRTPGEFSRGAIDGAKNLDCMAINFPEKLKKLDKKQAYLIYCQSGHRSRGTMRTFLELGFQEVYELKGGLLFYR
jgi:rhodanese-related sulfurtransferase